MNYQQAIEHTTQQLHAHHIAHLDILRLISHACATTPTQLLGHPQTPLCPPHIQKLTHTIAQTQQGMPIEYITQSAPFLNLNLHVTCDVLIPRPETEQMVTHLLPLLNKPTQTILDLCTGSGAIALAIKTHHPQHHITASDICPKALHIARHNITKHHLHIPTIQSNLFDNLTHKKFHHIITNPPYVDPNDTKHTQHTHEPEHARFSKTKGLWHILSIIKQAPQHLHSKGTLTIEHGFKQHQNVINALSETGFTHIQTHQDHQQHQRFTVAQYE